MKIEYIPKKPVTIDLDDLLGNLQEMDGEFTAKFAHKMGNDPYSSDYNEQYLIELMTRLNKELKNALKAIDAKPEYMKTCNDMQKLLKLFNYSKMELMKGE